MGRGVRESHPPSGRPDYYRLLQVDPDAPHELIVEAYWYLAGRLKNSRQKEPGLRERLEALNEAYATLISPEQRSSYDATLPRVRRLRQERGRAVEAASRRSWVSVLARRRASRVLPHYCDSYAALYVDPSAEPAIVDKAYSVLRVLHSNGVARARGLALSAAELGEAHAVLVDPARRAAYDASRAAPAESDASRPATWQPPAALVGPPPPHLEATAPTPEPATPAPDVRVSSLEPPAPVSEPAAPAAEATPPAPPHVMTQEAVPEGERREGVGKRAELAWAAQLTTLRGLACRSLVAARALLAVTAKVSSQRPPEVPDEVFADRLRREVPPVPAGESGQEPVEARPPLARLVLRDASGGKQILELGREPITLGAGPACDVLLEDEGSAVADQHACIWYSGGRFLLRSLAERRPTLVGGKPVVWAALEQGDEIEIGGWRLRFEILQAQPGMPDYLRAGRHD